MLFNPYPYQQYCIDRIVSDAAVGLFVEMGMGKSVITLSAILELRYNRWAIQKALVIAPKKVSEATWSVEAQKWEHLRGLRVQVVGGSRQARIRALATPADVYVISRDNTEWLVEHLGHSWDFDMVVLDESSSFKNSQSKRFKALKLVRSRITRMVLLTGTPSAQSLMDLWAQIYLLDGGKRLGRTLTTYREIYFTRGWDGFSYKARQGATEQIQNAISDICVSLRAEDYLQMPDLVVDDVPVVLDSKAVAVYKGLEREHLLAVPAGEVVARGAAVLVGKLLQLCNGAVYDDDKAVHEIHRAKIDAFMEVVEQLHGKSVLVFYAFQHDRDRLLAALAGYRVRVYQTPADADAWNAGQLDVLLAHPASCAYGINLQQGGHHIVWFGLTHSAEQYLQGNARLHRQGQGAPVVVHRLLVRGGMDEDVAAALDGKVAMQDALLNALKVRIQKAKGVAA
ncbi:MAG: DEAD/DEAH box helicase [Clostridiales bacterium]|nr:DEAD/DEAH box helicase [Clostridiales bacterium]